MVLNHFYQSSVDSTWISKNVIAAMKMSTITNLEWDSINFPIQNQSSSRVRKLHQFSPASLCVIIEWWTNLFNKKIIIDKYDNCPIVTHQYDQGVRRMVWLIVLSHYESLILQISLNCHTNGAHISSILGMNGNSWQLHQWNTPLVAQDQVQQSY